MAFNFEKLKIWQPALALSGAISDMVKDFPKDEFILSSQVKRAADSVVLNIAEGSTLQSKVEFRRFLLLQTDLLWKWLHACIFPLKENILTKYF